MKKIMSLFILFFCVSLYPESIKPILRLSIVQIHPVNNNTYHAKFNNYAFEFDLENISPKPIIYWTWTCFRPSNFIFLENYLFIDGVCLANVPMTVLLLPLIKKKYKGIICSRNKLTSENDINVGFVFYDGLKFTEREFFSYI